MNRTITSEAVTEGHPDKICDQISDAILDAILTLDRDAHVAVECAITADLLLIMGEVRARAKVDYAAIARKVIADIGYRNKETGFDLKNAEIIVKINEQSEDIARGVDKEDSGAGDQGMMFGYACAETEEYLPLSLVLAQRLVKRLAEVRKQGILAYLRPDGKAQVTIRYKHDKKWISNLVISAQHEPTIGEVQIRKDLIKEVVEKCIAREYLSDTEILINPTGRFVLGGPAADSGLTGRKIIVDTYGGVAHHGGGSFSGKDPSKVDRSAAYMARYIAKNLVAAGVTSEAEVALAYAIGIAEPLSVDIRVERNAELKADELVPLIKKIFDLRPTAIISQLQLKQPIYRRTAAYGHFGRPELDLPWERLDRVEEIKSIVKEIKGK